MKIPSFLILRDHFDFLEKQRQKAMRVLFFWNKEGLNQKKRGREQAILDNQAYASNKKNDLTSYPQNAADAQSNLSLAGSESSYGAGRTGGWVTFPWTNLAATLRPATTMAK